MPTLINTLLQDAESSAERAAREIKDLNYAIRLCGHLDLSVKTTINPYGISIWFMVSEREDVEKIMTLCPAGKFWSKRSSGEQIVYEVILDDGKILNIYVSGAALPPTCEIEEVEEIVPAQPETTKKVRRLKCAQPLSTDVPMPVAVPDDGEQVRLNEENVTGMEDDKSAQGVSPQEFSALVDSETPRSQNGE